MELIVFPIAFIYFVWLHRQERLAGQGKPCPYTNIAADLTIERDDKGNIHTISIRTTPCPVRATHASPQQGGITLINAPSSWPPRNGPDL